MATRIVWWCAHLWNFWAWSWILNISSTQVAIYASIFKKIARTWMSYDGKRNTSATYSWSRILPSTLEFLNFPEMKKNDFLVRSFNFIEIDINQFLWVTFIFSISSTYFIFMKSILNLVAQNFSGIKNYMQHTKVWKLLISDKFKRSLY